MSILHFPLFINDWGKGVALLSDAERGVYITLLVEMYSNAGPIVRDDQRLARLCGCKTTNAFRKTLNYLIDQGHIIENDGYLSNKKVEETIEILIEKSSKAKAAAEAKWSKKGNKINKGGDANAYANADANAYANQSQREKELDKSSSKKGSRLPDDWLAPKEFVDWPVQNLGWTENRAQGELAKFKDYWVSKTGQGATKLDWLATWRNWCRNAKTPNIPHQRRTLAQVAMDQVRAENERKVHEQSTADRGADFLISYAKQLGT